MPTLATDANDLVLRLRRDLSAVPLDCECRATLDSAFDRFSALEQRRQLRSGLEDARRRRDWIAAQLAFLAELDDITDREADVSVFEEMALLFDEIGAAAGAAALAIREAAAPSAADAKPPARPGLERR